MHFLYSNLS